MFPGILLNKFFELNVETSCWKNNIKICLGDKTIGIHSTPLEKASSHVQVSLQNLGLLFQLEKYYYWQS